MKEELMDLISGWDGNGVVVKHDRETGTWIFIALHDNSLGPSVGGCRMKIYPSQVEALRDAMRLAGGMTRKWAAAGLPMGGGKMVLSVTRIPEGAERAGLFRRVGRLVNTLRGAFATGMDLGTEPQDMLRIAEQTRYVHGVSSDGKRATDPGTFTAAGVLSCIKAAVARSFGDESLVGRSVLVQGVGGVGKPLARLLSRAGARVLVSDIDEQGVAELASELDAEVVPPHVVYSIHCDVYSPCAVGATLNKDTIPQLNCSVIAGSANNQLETPEDADLIHKRGILYAPDYITNSGGAVAFYAIGTGLDEGAAMEQASLIGGRLTEILAEAELRSESPARAAERKARQAIEAS